MAQSSDQIVVEDEKMAQQALEVIVQVTEFVKKNAQQQDPTIVVGMADVERKRAKDEVDNELANRREDNLRKLEAVDKLADEKQMAFDQMLETQRVESDEKFKFLSQQVEMMKNDADNRQKQMTELLKNHDDNKTAVIVAQIKEVVQAETQKFLADKEYLQSIEVATDPVQNSDTQIE